MRRKISNVQAERLVMHKPQITFVEIVIPSIHPNLHIYSGLDGMDEIACRYEPAFTQTELFFVRAFLFVRSSSIYKEGRTNAQEQNCSVRSFSADKSKNSLNSLSFRQWNRCGQWNRDGLRLLRLAGAQWFGARSLPGR